MPIAYKNLLKNFVRPADIHLEIAYLWFHKKILPGAEIVKEKVFKLTIACLLSAAFAGCATSPEVSPSGMAACPAGSNGGGGSYRPESNACQDGAIVPVGMKLCKKGSNGGGGIYNPNAAACSDGKIY